jgi:hypothetical protein
MLLIIEIILIVSSTKLKSIFDLAALYGELVISPCFIYIFIMSMYIYIMLSVLYQSNEFPSTTSTLTSRSKDVYFFQSQIKQSDLCYYILVVFHVLNYYYWRISDRCEKYNIVLWVRKVQQCVTVHSL